MKRTGKPVRLFVQKIRSREVGGAVDPVEQIEWAIRREELKWRNIAMRALVIEMS
jgi:hypothetical protein